MADSSRPSDKLLRDCYQCKAVIQPAQELLNWGLENNLAHITSCSRSSIKNLDDSSGARMRYECRLAARVSLSLCFWTALVVLSMGIAAADIEDREGRLITAGPPIYPAYCLKKRLQGYVDFVFVVDVDGLVRDASVVNSVVFRKREDRPVDDERAERAFISAATTALGNYRYEPPIKNGQILETEGVRTRISFKIGR